ncbi:Rho termination factor N-terminal domain-containing protein [Romeria aff. gracilis LEGE 07310]|uniref:Rho termination factor N-terminal domain-containing protein n=2 Tax=Vasconcelosia TaxID=3366328 RepID=A0A8J7AWC9_9CYAN|nr:Rho termination factor N-terminal domain-containing protein [Romeria aff. gracilis LEGE 07310]
MDKNELQQAVKTAQADQLQQQTRDQLYEQAQSLDIEGRSQMNKDALVEAIQAQSDPQG